MIYKAYLNQGEGCDYTIGCGKRIVDLKSQNYDEAMAELVLLIKDEYNGERELKSAELYEIEKVESINVREIYQWVEQQAEIRKQKEKEEKEREEFERLKSKFGN